MRRFITYGIVGASAGSIAAIVGNFLMPRMEFGEIVNSTFNARKQYAYNQPHEYITYALLGALICSIIGMLSNEPKGVKVQFRTFWVGLVLGGLLCAGANVLVNFIGLQMSLKISADGILNARQARGVHDVCFVLYYTLVPSSVAWGLGISVGLNRFMAVRSLIASGLASLMSGILIHLALFIILPIFILQASSNPRNMDMSSLLKPLMIVHLFGMGLGAAIAFAIAQAIYKPAWLRGIGGRQEGRTLPIPAPAVVIGCMEGVGLFLPPDGTVAPQHAQIDSQDEKHLIRSIADTVFVNGSPVQEHWLADNDVVQIGSYRFRYRNRLDPHAAQTASGPAPVIQQAPVMPVGAPTVPPPPGPVSPGGVATLNIPIVNPIASPTALTLVDPMGGNHPIGPGKTIVGRDDSADISLKWESTVSRRHVEISAGASGVTVTDLGSSNGTFVNGIAVASAVPLRPGDELRLGRCVLQIR